MNSIDLTPVFAPSVIVKIEIDAVVRLLDDFGRDAHVIAAGMAIDFGDALGVGLHHRTRQRAARLGLDFRRKLLVLDLLVALEGDAADHRVFDHGHHDAAAGLVDLHVLEQAGLDQRLQAVIDCGLVQPAAGARLEIGADGLDLDAPVALDLDRSHGLGGGRRRHKHSRQRGGDRHGEHDQGGQQAPPHSHSKHSCATRPYHSDAGPHPYEPANSHLLPCL